MPSTYKVIVDKQLISISGIVYSFEDIEIAANLIKVSCSRYQQQVRSAIQKEEKTGEHTVVAGMYEFAI